MSDMHDRIDQLEKENKRLCEELERLRSVMDQVGVSLYVKDIEGKYTYANKQVCDLFGVSLPELIGRDDHHFFSFQESDDLLKHNRLVLYEGQVVEEEERNIIASTGKTHYYMTVKKPLLDDTGQIVGMFGVSTDITERKEIEIKAREKQELLDTVMNNIDALVYMKDRDYRYLYINPLTAKIMGFDLNNIVGKKDEELYPEEAAQQFRKMDSEVFEHKEKMAGEEFIVDSKGNHHYFWSTKVPLKNDGGEITGLIGFSSDITELSILRNELREQVQEEISKRLKQEYLAITDPLTGVFNRIKLDEVLEKELDYAARNPYSFGIMLLDIDHFKEVNDVYGHQVGDQTLIGITDVLAQHVQSPDVIGRWGGEEFMIICADMDKQALLDKAEMLRQFLEMHEFPYIGRKTASIGLAIYQPKDTIREIVSRADNALYRAKHAGRNLIAI